MKTIEGFENYFIDEDGFIFNGRRLAIVSTYMYKGTLQVILWRRGTRVTKSVHILVAEAFMPNYDPALKVWRKDRDPANCRLDNLYQRPVDRLVAEVGDNSPLVSLYCFEAQRFYYSVREAGRALGVSYSMIYKQLRGEIENVRGYTFEWCYSE